MVIWFAGILHVQDTCCNKTNENKTNKQTKTLSCECGVFYTITRVGFRAISCKY